MVNIFIFKEVFCEKKKEWDKIVVVIAITIVIICTIIIIINGKPPKFYPFPLGWK